MKNIPEMKKQLVEQIERQAEWREQRAVEYPDDDRNGQSAASLRRLAKQLGEFPTTDPRWRRLLNCYYGNSDDARCTIIEAESEALRLYGFHEEKNGNPADFLDFFIDRVQVARGTHPVLVALERARSSDGQEADSGGQKLH